MGSKRCTIPTFAVVLCLVGAGVLAQSPVGAPEAGGLAPEPGAGGSDCFTALANMSDCLTYVEEGSKKAKPDKGCCPELAGLVDSNPICLCRLLAMPDFAGVKIDLNKALKLPSVCGVSTPPLTTCSAVGVPVSLPPSPSQAAPTTASPEVTKTSPSQVAANPSDGALSIKAPLVPFIFGLTTALVPIFF